MGLAERWQPPGRKMIGQKDSHVCFLLFILLLEPVSRLQCKPSYSRNLTRLDDKLSMPLPSSLSLRPKCSLHHQ